MKKYNFNNVFCIKNEVNIYNIFKNFNNYFIMIII